MLILLVNTENYSIMVKTILCHIQLSNKHHHQNKRHIWGVKNVISAMLLIWVNTYTS